MVNHIRWVTEIGGSINITNNSGFKTIPIKILSIEYCDKLSSTARLPRSLSLRSKIKMMKILCSRGRSVYRIAWVEFIHHSANFVIKKILNNFSFYNRKLLREVYHMIDTCNMYLNLFLRGINLRELIRTISMIFIPKNLTKLSMYYV
jgi:hypothetical protein